MKQEKGKKRKMKSTFIPDGYGLHTELYFRGFTDTVLLFLICVLSWNNYVYYLIASLYNKANKVPEQYRIAVTVTALQSPMRFS